MGKSTNRYSPEVRERAVRMVSGGEGQRESRCWSLVGKGSCLVCGTFVNSLSSVQISFPGPGPVWLPCGSL